VPKRKISLYGSVAAASIALLMTPVAASPVLAQPKSASQTATPIQHLVVIFQENVSFDHYFATYPHALNPAGENPFHAAPGTPSVNGLSGPLLDHNPNESNPQRLDPSQAVTCDQDHSYTAEQSAFDHGLMDQFVQDTGGGLTLAQCLGSSTPTPGNYAVMDYYDGNTVTGLWNYAQHFALSDNSFGTNFGPSTSGAINVTSGDTYGVVCGPSKAVYGSSPCSYTAPPTATGPDVSTPAGAGTDYSDADPVFDICSNGAQTGGTYSAASDIEMGGTNIGDLLDQAGVTWGWFEGGFAGPDYVPGNPSSDTGVCIGSHKNIAGGSSVDYIPHHEPFQYYASTANPEHLPPTSIAKIGYQDQANHQYDLKDFWAAADHGNLPAVSYLKAPAYEDGHAGYSDPIDEQQFLVNTINALEKLPPGSPPRWSSTGTTAMDGTTTRWAPSRCSRKPASTP
jgi:phospholipase C